MVCEQAEVISLIRQILPLVLRKRKTLGFSNRQKTLDKMDFQPCLDFHYLHSILNNLLNTVLNTENAL